MEQIVAMVMSDIKQKRAGQGRDWREKLIRQKRQSEEVEKTAGKSTSVVSIAFPDRGCHSPQDQMDERNAKLTIKTIKQDEVSAKVQIKNLGSYDD